MAYSKLSSKFPFILLTPQREVLTVEAYDRSSVVYAERRLSAAVQLDRTATVAAVSLLVTVPAQSRIAYAQPE